jgi:pterin-4a-carbinolamine dehydratase
MCFDQVRSTMAVMIKMKMMQTISCQRILRGCSRQKVIERCIISRFAYSTSLQHRPALQCRRLLSSGSSSDQKLEDGSVAGQTPPPPQQQQRPPKRRIDPMAKRPTVKCDPYGQGGKPMSWMEAETLLSTLRLHSDWKLVPVATQTPDLDESSQPLGNETTSTTAVDAPQLPPHALGREFVPTDFLSGAKLVQKLAAVAQLDNHFPACLTLSRKIVRKEWQVVTAVQCHTTVLGGLSTNDFHLAMVRSRQ